MGDFLVAYLPWLLSASVITMMMLAGSRWRWTWVFGLGSQALWVTWIVLSETWGMLPMSIVLFVVYARNHLKWRQLAVTI